MIKVEEKIDYLVGKDFKNRKILEPFNKIICDFLIDLSSDLNQFNNPDIKALAFWCRNANIMRLKNLYKTNDLRLGLGLIFHITPSNIPTNFAYSLIFGLITGNSNIVKVPSKKFKEIDIVCKSIKKTLKKYKEIKNMISIVRYKNNEHFTKKISLACNARVIWGGDKSITNIRTHPIDQRAIDLTFADRYSFCAIDSNSIMNLNNHDIKKVAEKFYNDTYVVDQNACSSPHLIMWIGKKNKTARAKFWEELNKIVGIKYDFNESTAMEKLTHLCSDILKHKNILQYKKYSNSLYTLELDRLNYDNQNLRGKWGFFYEYSAQNLNDIKKLINNRYQTLTYFGINKTELENFVFKNKLNGIDRIVPIGQALDIGLIWDGYDICKILSRIVDIR